MRMRRRLNLRPDHSRLVITSTRKRRPRQLRATVDKPVVIIAPVTSPQLNRAKGVEGGDDERERDERRDDAAMKKNDERRDEQQHKKN